jgi:hypothetical protein
MLDLLNWGMAEWVNGYSADGTHAELVVLVVAVLAAIAETLVPGITRIAGVLRVAPVPGLLEFLGHVLVEQRLLGAVGQIASEGLGPFHAVFPILFLIAGQQDGVDGLAIGQGDAEGEFFAFLQIECCEWSDFGCLVHGFSWWLRSSRQLVDQHAGLGAKGVSW